MSTLKFSKDTPLTPEQYIAGLTDFGPGRRKLFPNSSDDKLVVHDSREGWADVTEGAGGVWERLHYDWSNRQHVTLKTVDSNVWGGGSGHDYTFSHPSSGVTRISVTVVREGKNLLGRVLGLLLGSAGKASLQKAFEQSVRAIEARNHIGVSR